MPAAALPIPTSSKPARDTVLYDGQCRFCRSQMALLRRLDLTGQLQLTSLHDPAVARDFPEIPPAELMQQVMATAQRLADNAPISVRQAKKSIHQGLQMDLKTGLHFEVQAYDRMISTQDRLEGIRAFNEKRKPVFKGC